ncbi:MAG TPA: cytochrome c biogenesis protein CcdA [Pseudomonadales bacterium]|nr:cytochrome C biogenesis protein [Gammaproteobacteria bacterium]MDP6027909.1 cytochrome c biogenesis protein CcdA [Pseudomonadales bacterium]MDP6316132.1 cytochrome c biogenesis protein CcdA [Pseudomonadales bacterium]MDP7315602.1 cytochrome c biogenesis protein CcdA [Pseudomonadales bacterium]MDP7576997.1 cytochrome c biogenesis protein CcdA [Pseudomonadales bacterium]
MESVSELLISSLASGSILALALAYSGGVLTSATPCVYPMIPITIGVIGSSAESGRLRGFINSLIYATGLASVYGGLGVIAAASGQMFGEISTNPWGYFLVANLCLVFGAWMIGWIQIPHVGVSTMIGDKVTIGWLRLFLIGGASGLVAGPCTAPVLATLLTFVASTGNVIYGGILLFVFAFGLSTLLIVIGTFSGFLAAMPKSGNWMNWIKGGMALIMFGAGEYFLVQMGLLLF